MKLRTHLYAKSILKSYQSNTPIISVGNVSIGGNGKTPLCVYLANLLEKQGYKPIILLKGYGGKLKGPLLVNNSHSAKEVGDEALIYQNKTNAKVVVSYNKKDGAIFIDKNKFGNIIILDDGLQHLALARNVNISCFYIGSANARNNILKPQTIPAGNNRENFQSAIQRIDIAILSHRSNIKNVTEAELKKVKDSFPPKIELFESLITETVVENAESKKKLKPQKIFATCALANPDAFYQTLESSGFTIEKRISHRDHKEIDKTKLTSLINNSNKIPIVCSEKDLVKIPRELHKDLYVLRTHTEIENSQKFISTLQKYL